MRLAMFARAGTIALLLLGTPPAAAQTIDPHRLYETRCGGCHGPHAADFAKRSLRQANGLMVGARSGKDLVNLLTSHRGTNLAPAEIEALVGHFGAILPTGWLFQDKCRICHDRAVYFARTKLTIKDGRLIGLFSGRDVETFLADHGRLEKQEIPVIVQMLERQLATKP